MVFKHLREEARLILVFLINKDPVFCSLLFSGASFEQNYNFLLSKGQKISKANYGVFNSPKIQTKKLLERNVLFLHLFFGRIEDTRNCFQDLMTFSKVVIIKAM